MFALIIIVGVAAGAIGAVCRRCPGGGLGIGPVAGDAKQVATVITRVFSGGMTEINGQPVVCVVAGITLQSSAKVIARFSRRLCAIMTTGTGAAHAIVIETGGYPAGRVVAVIALGAGLDMVG